jgi:hypothetical protein
MPGIKISKKVREALPEEDREGLEDLLWDKSAGLCHLCERPLNQATDDIEPDHDDPGSEGGPTTRANLHLAHQRCNRAKKSFPTVDVRPWLRLKEFTHERGGVVKYSDLFDHFGYQAKESKLKWSTGSSVAKWHFPDKRIVDAQVFAETDGAGVVFEYCFLEVPREAIWNDDECQPRTIKVAQAWAIYMDTQFNPLHEPPSCRVIRADKGAIRLAMFDGQHKSVSVWMRGRRTVVIKVYLNLDKDQTIRLVGSIQSRIKKLPLSSFEHAMKMGEEWAAQALAYEDTVGTEHASESGLIAWLPVAQRQRAKDAARAGLLRDVLEMEDLKLLDFVIREGREKRDHHLITETAFKQKVVANLRDMAPLKEQGESWEKARAREIENIQFALNTLADGAFLASDGTPNLTGADAIRRDRMKYQSSLAYVAILLRKLYRQVLSVDDEARSFLEKEPTREQKVRIQAGIERIVEHPIWKCDLDMTAKTRAVKDALQKNQDAAVAFRGVELRGDYVHGTENLPPSWKD